MKNRLILGIACLFFLLLCMYHFRPIQVYDLLEINNKDSFPKSINSSIYFSAMSKKELMINDEDSIQEFITFLGNIKVRKVLTFPTAYVPKFKNTYRIILNENSNRFESIYILNSEFIEINRQGYKIGGKPNLSKLYEIIILAQEEGKLDKFYYDLLDKNE